MNNSTEYHHDEHVRSSLELSKKLWRFFIECFKTKTRTCSDPNCKGVQSFYIMYADQYWLCDKCGKSDDE